MVVPATLALGVLAHGQVGVAQSMTAMAGIGLIAGAEFDLVAYFRPCGPPASVAAKTEPPGACALEDHAFAARNRV